MGHDEARMTNQIQMTNDGMTKRIISVIIPAHNEENSIARGVRALAGEGTEVIVVANGCTDGTAAVVRELGLPGVVVVETPVGNKVKALNLGDGVATGWPRFYVDADVVLTREGLMTIARVLESGEVLAAAPSPSFDVSKSSWGVRAFYRINTSLPSFGEGIGGSGVYAMSELGRKRFGEFPAVTADDGFVRIQFKPGERRTVKEVRSVVFAPRNLKELVAIKTRSHYGSVELRETFPELWANKGSDNEGALKRLAMRPWLWPAIAVYVWVKWRARKGAAERKRKKEFKWERDESSRK